MPFRFEASALSSIFACAFAGPHARQVPGKGTAGFFTEKLVKPRPNTIMNISHISMHKCSHLHDHLNDRMMCSQTSLKSRRKRLHGFTKLLAPASIVAASILSPTAAAASQTGATALLPSSTMASSYHLTRILFLRLLAFVYMAAFSVAKFQNKGLIGDRGITPARKILDDAQQRGEVKSARRKQWLAERANYSTQSSSSRSKGGDIASLFTRFISKCITNFSDSFLVYTLRDKFWYRTDRMDRPLPTLLWFAPDRNNLNPWLDGLANSGLFLSSIMLSTGSSNVLLMLGLWIIQRSLMSVGGPWYGYGWEPQLAELTFHALFLVPLLSMDPFFGWNSLSTAGAGMGAFPVPQLIIWAIRWYLFKIMIGAGLIKVKSSDPKWKPGNSSAMYHFYETQVGSFIPE